METLLFLSQRMAFSEMSEKEHFAISTKLSNLRLIPRPISEKVESVMENLENKSPQKAKY
jgi:hypothetical protein